MLEEYFKFPVVHIDGDNEERKQEDKKRFGDLPTLDTEEEDEYDMIFGEAEYPYWNFIGIEDRWLPSKSSLEKALAGEFDACLVRFVNVGQLLVPWTKEKFKRELKKFAEAYTASNPPDEGKEIKVLTLTAEQFKNVTGDGKQE